VLDSSHTYQSRSFISIARPCLAKLKGIFQKEAILMKHLKCLQLCHEGGDLERKSAARAEEIADTLNRSHALGASDSASRTCTRRVKVQFVSLPSCTMFIRHAVLSGTQCES
jgi:hypothetical protein